MRAILIQRHGHALKSDLSTWKKIPFKPIKRPSAFYNYGEKRSIEFVDVTKRGNDIEGKNK